VGTVRKRTSGKSNHWGKGSTRRPHRVKGSNPNIPEGVRWKKRGSGEGKGYGGDCHGQPLGGKGKSGGCTLGGVNLVTLNQDTEKTYGGDVILTRQRGKTRPRPLGTRTVRLRRTSRRKKFIRKEGGRKKGKNPQRTGRGTWAGEGT